MNKTNRFGIVCLGVATILIGLCLYFAIFHHDETKPVDNEINESIEKEKNDNNENIEGKQSDNSINEIYKPVNFDQFIKEIEEDKTTYERLYGYIESDLTLPKIMDINSNGKQYTVEITEGKELKVNGIVLDEGEALIDTAADIGYVKDTKFFVIMDYGDVYEYILDNFDQGNYSLSKIEGIKDAVKFVRVSLCYKNSDCKTLLGVIDKENQFIEVDNGAI